MRPKCHLVGFVPWHQGIDVSHYKFSASQRFAIYQVHGPVCYMCRELVTLTTMQIDHIIPEQLSGDLVALEHTLTELGLHIGFDLNSYENWLPACARCNNFKRGYVFKAAPLHLSCLERARIGAEKCRQAEGKSVKSADVAKALTYLERAAEQDELDLEQLMPLILAYAKANPDAWNALIAEARPIDHLGFETLPEFLITPIFKVVFTNRSLQVVRTPRHA